MKNRKRYYSSRFSAIMHHGMTQVSFKLGLKHFKEKGRKYVSKELLQLHLNNIFRPLTPGDLSDKNKDAALEFLMFLKEKRNKSLKGRACADGRN